MLPALPRAESEVKLLAGIWLPGHDPELAAVGEGAEGTGEKESVSGWARTGEEVGLW